MNQYIFVRDGVEEAVQAERWGWEVVYKDGTKFKQFNDDGMFHQFSEIKQEEVSRFVMYKLDEPVKRHEILVEEGMKLFHFYRNFVFNMATEFEVKSRVYVFGWKNRISGDGTFVNILPNDQTVILNNDVDLHKYGLI